MEINIKVVRIFLLFFVFFFNLFLSSLESLNLVRNNLQQIDACEGKIKLILVRIWGGDNKDDENQFFRFPNDVKLSANGQVYILDSGNNRIQAFDRNGDFTRTIGSVGQGPGDLSMPGAFDLDKKSNIVIADTNNYRIQFFDPKGNYLSSFKCLGGSPRGVVVTEAGQIAVYSHQKSFTSGSLVTLYDWNGKITGKIGEIRTGKGKRNQANFESFFFTLDKEDNILISHYALPLFRRYSTENKLLMITTYELPFKTPGIQLNSHGDDVEFSGEKKEGLSAGITVDQDGRIYLAVASRPKTKKEIFFLVSGQDGTVRRYPQKFETENTDRFRLLVFSSAGKIIAAKKLNVFCDKLYVYGNKLFVIDSYIGMKIYEYSLTF